MSEMRAAKSGIAKDTQEKIAGKYDQCKAAQCMEWIRSATGQDIDCSGDVKKVHEALKDGHVLLKLLAVIQSVPYKPKKGSMSFQEMERISIFINAIKMPPLGIAEQSTFATVDLWEEIGNKVQVITCLEAVARRSQTLGTPAGGYGPKESEVNKREFTEAQMAAGKNVIGLQMGSNKGATQAGQNFGKGRMITD